MNKTHPSTSQHQGDDPQDRAQTTGEGANTALAAMLKKRRQRVENESQPVPLDGEASQSQQRGTEA